MNTTNHDAKRTWFLKVRPILCFLGSLKLAMLLLGVIIVACMVGTVAESRLDTAVAQAYFYDAPWFFAWLLLLCLNLIGAVLVRYPWKPHQIGFIITHAGIVVLLIGAFIGRTWGVEGSMTLFKGRPPVDYMIMNQTVLEVKASQTREAKSTILNVNVRPPTVERPFRLKLGDITVSALGVAQQLGVGTVVQKSAEGSPALRVILRSSRHPEPLDQWMVLGDPARDTIDFGTAKIRFAAQSAEPTNEPTPAPIAGKPPEAQAEGVAEQGSRERHFVFAKMPEMGMTRSIAGQSTGIKASYQLTPSDNEKEKSKGILELRLGEQRFEFGVDQLLEKSVALPGTPWSVRGVKYLADFRMEGKEAVSVSDAPNNPALVFEIFGVTTSGVGSAGAEKCDHGDHAEGECKHSGQACCPKPGGSVTSHTMAPHGTSTSQNSFTIYSGADGKLSYASYSKDKKTASGEIQVGQEVSTGLADWKLEIKESLPKATVREALAPLSSEAPQPIGTSGLLIHAKKGNQTAKEWVALGTPAHLRLGDDAVHVSFGYRMHPLSFSVALEDFEVERNEGTQTPAGFKSRIRFLDPKDAAASNAVHEVWMNHPANFPNFTGVGLLGTAYKFSQASWNPNNLHQTTLQVLRDPGWSLKWIGSLLLCGGLFVMFYLKPYPRLTESRKS